MLIKETLRHSLVLHWPPAEHSSFSLLLRRHLGAVIPLKAVRSLSLFNHLSRFSLNLQAFALALGQNLGHIALNQPCTAFL